MNRSIALSLKGSAIYCFYLLLYFLLDVRSWCLFLFFYFPQCYCLRIFALLFLYLQWLLPEVLSFEFLAWSREYLYRLFGYRRVK